ncbi:hypothetical protein T484DRAFT_1816548 [Baffinella frigidus]|nr:hypothetical protein T484DRAFT_1816548 [Cryptophyta sp. CCMP2293]
MALFAKHGLSSEAPPTGGEAGAKAEVSLGGWELHRGVGSRLMHQAGWRPGQGLGARNDGRVDPIPANLRLDRTCVGHPEAQAMPSEQAAHQLNHFSPGKEYMAGMLVSIRNKRTDPTVAQCAAAAPIAGKRLPPLTLYRTFSAQHAGAAHIAEAGAGAGNADRAAEAAQEEARGAHPRKTRAQLGPRGEWEEARARGEEEGHTR